MTRDDFLLAFRAALRRPGVRLMAAPLTIPVRVFLVSTGHGGAFLDPVGLVWWDKTGVAGPGTFLDAFKVALALGLLEQDALDLLRATDYAEGLSLSEEAWQAGLLKALRSVEVSLGDWG